MSIWIWLMFVGLLWGFIGFCLYCYCYFTNKRDLKDFKEFIGYIKSKL